MRHVVLALLFIPLTVFAVSDPKDCVSPAPCGPDLIRAERQFGYTLECAWNDGYTIGVQVVNPGIPLLFIGAQAECESYRNVRN
jgi:hypothetical protein